MFCPQCKAEYRQGVTRCAECDADLVATTPAEGNSIDFVSGELDGGLETGILWEGDDQVAYQAMQDALQEAAIPFLAGRSRKNLDTKLWPLLALRSIGQFYLRVAKESLSAAREATVHIVTEPRTLFCPLCKAEIFAEFARCEDCLSPLVSSPNDLGDNPPVVLWWGRNEKRFREFVEAVQSTGIACHNFEVHARKQSQTVGFRWLGDFARPFEKPEGIAVYVAVVRRSDVERALSAAPRGSNGEWMEASDSEGIQLFRADGTHWVEVYFSTLDHPGREVFEALDRAGLDFDVVPDERECAFWFVSPHDEARAREIVKKARESEQFKKIPAE